MAGRDGTVPCTSANEPWRSPGRFVKLVTILKALLGRRMGFVIASAARCALFGLLLLVAACASGSATGSSDDARNHGFYGGVTGGSQP
jgi:hypothetical protein